MNAENADKKKNQRFLRFASRVSHFGFKTKLSHEIRSI